MPRALGRISFTSMLVLPVIAACGTDDAISETPARPSRVIEIAAAEYSFNGDPGEIAAGETIEFVVDNVGQIDHSLEVLSEAGSSLGATERIGPGQSDSVTVTLAEAGVYRLICDVDDHLSRGQIATITVS